MERLEADRLGDNVLASFGDRSGGGGDSLFLGSPLLDKYDETSMGQVNEIITMFQRLNV